jgi:transcriptional accessory protein Tex/SPT6
MHVSETPLARGEKPASHYAEGDPVRVRVLRIEPAEQRIGLSSRDVEQPTRDASSDASEAPPASVAAAPEDAPVAPDTETGKVEDLEATVKTVPAGTEPHE